MITVYEMNNSLAFWGCCEFIERSRLNYLSADQLHQRISQQWPPFGTVTSGMKDATCASDENLGQADYLSVQASSTYRVIHPHGSVCEILLISAEFDTAHVQPLNLQLIIATNHCDFII